MRVDLKVTHTPDLKSKQPWPKLVWQGSQVSNLLLLDTATQRMKVLCVTPSGKGDSKKKIAKLQSRLQHICVACISQCGNLLVCLQHSGDLLIWNKDIDKLQTVSGIPELVTHKPQSGNTTANTKTPRPHLFISKDARKLLVVIGYSQLFLWEMDQSGVVLSGKQAGVLKGNWSHIGVSESHTMPSAECKETAVHGRFFLDSVLGECCICSFVFNNKDHIHATSVLLSWTAPQFIYSVRQPKFTARWDSFQYPLSGISPDARPIRHRGAYIAQHAHSGNTLAVAANQRSPFSNRIVFLSVMSSGAIVVDLKGCGCVVKKPNLEYARSYWIGDLSWTHDDLFLVCLTKRGSLTILSRLGEPLVLQSEGCSVKHGPQYYIPFHPLITIVPSKPLKSSTSTPAPDDQQSPTSSLKSEVDEKRQRFSVSTHPTKPIIVCSDGYLATIMELPESLTCTSLMTDFLSEGRTALNHLSERQQLGLKRLGTFKLQQTMEPPSSQLKQSLPLSPLAVSGLQGTLKLQQTMQPPSSQLKQSLPLSPLAASGLQGANTTAKGLISTIGSEADYAGPYSNLDEGKIVFGYPMELGVTTQGGTLSRTDSGSMLAASSRAQRALFSTLGLGLSHSGIWTTKLDHLLLLTVSSIVRLCEVMLLHEGADGKSSRDKSLSLRRVCTLYQDAMSVFLWDVTSRTSQPTALKMSHWMVSALVRHHQALPSCLAQRASVVILQFSEQLLGTVYTMLTTQQPSFHINHLSFHDGDVVEGAHFAAVRGKRAPPMGHVYTYVDGQRSGYHGYGSTGTQAAKVPVRCLLGKSSRPFLVFDEPKLPFYDRAVPTSKSDWSP